MELQSSEFRKSVAKLALKQGLPPIGTSMTNQYGLNWLVTEYAYAATPPALARTPQVNPGHDPLDLMPVIVPLNISKRMSLLVLETDRCTSKLIRMVDTLPDLHPQQAGRNIHYAHVSADPYCAYLHLDAARLHETTLAHEMMHLWLLFVEGCDDLRVMRDSTDSGKVNQLQFIQSFVLDLRVNDLIEERGFDMALLDNDQLQGVLSIAEAARKGYSPPTKREAAVLGPIIAAALLDQKRWSKTAKQKYKAALKTLEAHLPEVFSLAKQFAASVRRHGYGNITAIRAVIDDCTIASFRATEDNFDLERDLRELALSECMLDKFPEQFAGMPVPVKLEIGRAMARHRIGAHSKWHIQPTWTGQVQIQFQDTHIPGEWTPPTLLNYWLPSPLLAYPKPQRHHSAVIGLNHSTKESAMKQEYSVQQSSHLPSQVAAPQHSMEAEPSLRRNYMAGVGLWLGTERMKGRKGIGYFSANLYQYTYNNPVNYVDRTGLSPGDDAPSGNYIGQVIPCPPEVRNARKTLCADLTDFQESCSVASL